MKKIRTIVKKVLSEMPLSFTGVKIQDSSEIEKLILMAKKNMEELGEVVGSEWKKPLDYHMTVKLGKLPLGMQMRGDVGKEVVLKVQTLGVSDEAIAFGVSGYMSKNKKQHITLFFKNKPSDSNLISKWVELPYPFEVSGIIYEY